MGKLWGSLRHGVQLGFTALTNGYAAGFLQGKIYTGELKRFCVPGLNCYSCPGALGACPVGALQSVLTNRELSFSYYVIGFLVMVGALMGRVVCGWLCPFGLVQDLLYKIPFVKKRKRLPGDRWLKYLRYVILSVFVFALPLLVLDIVGQGKPWFCAYICPSGTLMAGIPLVSLNAELRGVIGWLFDWKVLLLAAFLVLSTFFYRPFCRYVCPLGVIYGPFNKIALYRFKIDPDKCTHCKACQRACGFDIPVYDNPNSIECIRCGDCKRACPTGAITSTLRTKKRKKQMGK